MSGPDSRTRSVLALLLVFALGGCTAAMAPPRVGAPRVDPSDVLAAVRAAPQIRTLPAGITPPPATAAADVGFDNEKCETGPAADRIEACVFGDPASAFQVMLYGDSRAGMWLPALIDIAERRHWRLRLFGKPSCPVAGIASRALSCRRFGDFVLGEARVERPELVIVTTGSFGQRVSARQWRAGLTATLAALRRAGSRVVVLGDLPVLELDPPECLVAHPDVSACSTDRSRATSRVLHREDRAAAVATGSAYLPVVPWLCSAVCTPVIGDVTVYRNRFHLTATYARRLTGVLEDALIKTYPAASRGDTAG